MRLPGTSAAEVKQLQELAGAYNVEIAYQNVHEQRCDASPESLLRVVQLLGAEVSHMADVPAALRQRQQRLWRTVLEPVNIAWDDEPPAIPLRIPARLTTATVHAELHFESGGQHGWQFQMQALAVLDRRQVEGSEYLRLHLPLPHTIPLGYHQLTLELAGKLHHSRIIAAPRRAFDPGCGLGARNWGAFLPLYSLHSQRSWGSGDFSDFNRLVDWLRDAGGRVVATLPLLATFLDTPFEPSPYSPASRLFWNDFFIDVEAIPELRQCDAARDLLASSEFSQSIADLRAAPLVDYRRQFALQRRILDLLSEHVIANSSPRREQFRAFLQNRPEVVDYARFRAVVDKHQAPWQEWPAHLRDGQLQDADGDETSLRYHQYAQWIASEQVERLCGNLKQGGMSLYLDLPLGVHRAGYDVWRERSAFVVDASGGCPPDAVFPHGQDWGFPPMHPEGIREQGYRYVIDYLQHQLQYAGILRIDHMPVFHRLFWIPPGCTAHDGVYVRYPAEELYGVFSLESHRHRVLLVGEDLGTVPPEVPTYMAVHHVHSMYVAQYALSLEDDQALPPAPHCSVASLNTHDMPPFAAFLTGQDIDERLELDLLGTLDPDHEHRQRQAMIANLTAFLPAQGHAANLQDPAQLLQACLAHLATSPARTLLVNLEDLWLETEPQNIPGTGDRFPNWRRKTKYSIEEFTSSPEVQAALRALNEQFEAAKSGSHKEHRR